MHWLLLRLLRAIPDAVPAPEIRETLKRVLTPAALQAEAEFIARPENGAPERPYGWGWALALTEEAARLADDGGSSAVPPTGAGFSA